MTYNPILSGLQGGHQFPFSILKDETEAIQAFWEWWWENCFDGSLNRPKTIQDEDPLVAQHTMSKEFVDTKTHDEFFARTLKKNLHHGSLPREYHVPRAEYRNRIVDLLLPEAPICTQRAICFTGGGYGAGKTLTLQHSIKAFDIQMKLETEVLHGVDYCKQLLPEFNIVKAMADGRASEICQTESRAISDAFFQRAVIDGRNFGWDSSMSHHGATHQKIDHALENGYSLDLIGVLTDTKVAIGRAMKRAQKTKRFAPPLYLEASHRDFCANLMTYIPKFDRAWIFENSSDRQDPILIAVKTRKTENLDILDENLFGAYIKIPEEHTT